MSGFVATMSPEQQEAFEVRIAQQEEESRLQEKIKARQVANKPLELVGVAFLDLPPEILTYIFLYLPFPSVAICQGVNRQLRALISESAQLQYYIHLNISGQLDNPRCDLSVSERLSHLLRRERHCEEFSFDFDRIVEVPSRPRLSQIQLSRGVFSVITGDASRYMRTPRMLNQEVKWREVRPEKTIISQGTCVYEHDLHVLITAQSQTIDTNTTKPSTIHEIQVHLNQVSTGEPHPDALFAAISFETREEFEYPRITVDSAGDNLLLVLWDYGTRNTPDNQVYVYEWKTGELRLRHSAPSRSYRYPLSLTTDIFILPNARTGELEYWRIPQSAAEPTPSQPFFVLSLPRLRSDQTFHYITCRAEPNRPRGGSEPFYSDPHHAIVIFTVHIQSAGSLTKFTFFIHRSSLVRRIGNLSASTFFNDRPQPVPYDEWGPSACRWFGSNGLQTNVLAVTFGQRFITPPPRRETRGTPLTLLNFNPLDAAKVLIEEERQLKAITLDGGSRSVGQGEGSQHAERRLSGVNAEGGLESNGKDRGASLQNSAGGVLDILPSPPGEQTEVYNSSYEPRSQAKAVTQVMDPLNDPNRCFENTVYSSLPYTVRSSQEKYSFDGLLLDEENILGIRMDGWERIKEIQVLHYG